MPFLFWFFFLGFLVWIFMSKGYAVDPVTKDVYLVNYKYFTNFMELPVVLVTFLLGVVAVLYGIGTVVFCAKSRKGIWFAGLGTVLTVTSLLLTVGYNNTSFYPSSTNIQSSLTIENASSSQFTLSAMSLVSLFIPVVLVYIFFSWRALTKKTVDMEDVNADDHAY